jgi:hypothetical protein
VAQRANGLPRHGGYRHDRHSFQYCSCYVPIDSRGSRQSQARSIENLFLIRGRDSWVGSLA